MSLYASTASMDGGAAAGNSGSSGYYSSTPYHQHGQPMTHPGHATSPRISNAHLGMGSRSGAGGRMGGTSTPSMGAPPPTSYGSAVYGGGHSGYASPGSRQDMSTMMNDGHQSQHLGSSHAMAGRQSSQLSYYQPGPLSPPANYGSPQRSQSFGLNSMHHNASAMDTGGHDYNSQPRNRHAIDHLFGSTPAPRQTWPNQRLDTPKSNFGTPFAPTPTAYRPSSDAGPARAGKIPTMGENTLLNDPKFNQPGRPLHENGHSSVNELNVGTPAAFGSQSIDNQGTGHLDRRGEPSECVTVYGFPPEDASFILREFEQYGTIIKKQIEKGGNWMHLQYSTKSEAEKALGKNEETLVQRKIMIGVCRCKDSNFVQSAVTQQVDKPNVLNSPMPMRTPRQPPRSLMQPTGNPGTPNKATPKQGAGFLNVAREYVLGW